MPELPEVETIRRELEREAAGKRVKAVEVTGMRSIRRHKTKRQFIAALEGTKISSVQRRGKYLLLKLDSCNILVIHLGMSGQLLKAQAKDPIAKHTHVVITFTQGGQLRFCDPRTFGEMFVTSQDELTDEVPELADLGIDPVDEPMSWTTFGELVMLKRTRLKTLLMDQRFIAGLGNIYSDEILWVAGLRYDRPSETLSAQEVRRLYRALVETLHEAIKHRGSTLPDQQYVDLYGRPGQYQHEHNAYDREGQACTRCRGTIVRAKFAGRSTFFCESCQT